MTRLEKLQSATADDLASLFTIMDDEGEYLPLLMPMNLVKDPDNLDEIIQSQSEWLQGEYWPGDFGLGCSLTATPHDIAWPETRRDAL